MPFLLNGKMDGWKEGKMERLKDVRAEVWSLSRMLSVPEGVVSL